MRFWLILVLAVGFGFSANAQTVSCSAATVLSARHCAGDDLTSDERELLRLINIYRIENKLPAIPVSEGLNMVANRHVMDLTINFTQLTHSWSNCPYDISNEATWPCIIGAPVRLNSSFKGEGFENLYRNYGGAATPALALEAWKRSPPHNALILNRDNWKDTKFDVAGVAINGGWASLWFGYSGSVETPVGREIRGLGISFEKLVSGLTETFKIERTSSIGASDQWIGESEDKSIRIVIYGSESEITESNVGLTAKLDAKSRISAANRTAMLRFLANLAPNWTAREAWFNGSVAKLQKAPGAAQRITIGEKTFEMKLGAGKTLTLGVVPSKKKGAFEL